MRRLTQSSMCALVALAMAACLPNNDGEVVLPAAERSPPAPVAPGLAEGCNEARTLGRFMGRLYLIPLETRRMPDFTALPAQGAVCLDRLDVSERRGYPSFPGVKNRYEWFGVSLEGGFTVRAPGHYGFRITSDDGSKLVIDGALVIDNDGYHTKRAKEGAIDLVAGEHTIDVAYWQGPGPLALILEVARPGASTYEVFRVDE